MQNTKKIEIKKLLVRLDHTLGKPGQYLPNSKKSQSMTIGSRLSGVESQVSLVKIFSYVFFTGVRPMNYYIREAY